MRRSTGSLFAFMLAFLTGVSALPASLPAADAKPAAAPAASMPAGAPDAEAMQAKFKAYAAPGENHKVLEALVGSWDAGVRMWQDPAGQPEESTGASENRWVMGGRFLEQRFTGQFMGEPFEGTGLIGYDNIKQKYQSVWIDSMGTGMMTGTASYDPSTKVLTETGSHSCPITGGDRQFRSVTTFVDADMIHLEFYGPGPDGKEFKGMEITYKRRSPAGA